MAKIAPKGKKVTGTKKADKITWAASKPWQRALTVNGMNGNDVINFKKSKYKNKLNGGNGNDKIYGGKNIDIIHGNSGNDILYGYNGSDKIYGDAGSDKIYGGNGNDYIYGGAGNDKLYGGTGNDKIYVGTGNDIVNAGTGTNYIYMKKKEGTNTIVNGKGKDTLVFSDEKNFDNFTFSTVGNDLKLSAGGTTALLKGFVTGNSSVVNVKAGNLSFNSVIIGSDEAMEFHGSDYNDLFIFNDNRGHSIYTENGNDILFLNNFQSYGVYAAKGNNYINASNSYVANLFLSGMNGNNVLLPNWNSYADVNFYINGGGTYGDNYQMVRSFELPNDDGTEYYILGQKSDNDLIMKAINGKTLTIKGFFDTIDMRSHIHVADYNYFGFNLYRGSNRNIFFADPEVINLGETPAAYSGVQNKYIYGSEDIGYNLTMNNSSYNKVHVYSSENVSINLQNAQMNTIELSEALFDYKLGGNNNYMYFGETGKNSVFDISGNNNYIEAEGIVSSTFKMNGNGNHLELKIDNDGNPTTMNISTQGSNEVNLNAFSRLQSVEFNINSQGADTFEQVNWNTEHFYYNYDFSGSEGKNKYINGGINNSTTINGVNDAGEIKFLADQVKDYVIVYNNYYNGVGLVDFDMDIMGYRSGQYCGPNILITAAESNAADLNTTAFANKFKISTDNIEFKTLNNFVQYFNILDNSFAFGNDEYMDNLTKDYIVDSDYDSDDTTYSGFTFDTGRHTIVDGGGSSDTLTVSENINDIRMYFNIPSTGSEYGDLYFLKSDEFQNFMKGDEVSGYLNIKNNFDSGKIENVQVGTYSLNYNNLTSDEVGSLIAEVSSWLTSDGRNYSDANAVITTGSDADKAALFNIYNTHTDFANNNANLYWGQG